MLYLRARYYNPADGRFQSRDTWSGDYSQPLSLSRWNYVEGNPVSRVDPTGHAPLRNGYVEGVSMGYGLFIDGYTEGMEIVYDYATMTRARFTSTGTVKGLVASFGMVAYVGGIGGFRYGPRLDVQDKNNLFVDDYSKDFYGVYFGVGVKPVQGLTVGVGMFHSPDWSVNGLFTYASGGFGIPVDGVAFHTYSTVDSDVEYYADETGHVDRTKLISDILKGDNSPIPFGAFSSFVAGGLGASRNGQIGTVLLAASLFEDYHRQYDPNIICPVPPRLYGPPAPFPDPFKFPVP